MDERQYDQLFVSIKSIDSLTTRIDERVQSLIKKQIKFDEDVVNLHENIHKMELRLSTLENSNNKSDQRWKGVTGFAVQLIWVILAAWLLYKLGIQSPDVP
jgi:hypothetical protein